MTSRFRHRAEQVALVTMATTGIAVLVADLLGWLDDVVDSETLPKVTLLILCTVTVFLLLELERLRVLDNVDRQLSKLDIDAVARELKHQHYCGVVRVHLRFPEDTFTELAVAAHDEIAILQTWIPNLHRFEWALQQAIIGRGVDVRVLLLHPHSPVARLREEALHRDPAMAEDVKANVERCLSIFEALASGVPKRDQSRLQVRLYNSLPSIAVYKADEHYLVSSFLHGQLAIDSPQLEIDGTSTAIGEQVEHELETLWRIGTEVDLGDWRRSLSAMAI